MRTIRLIRTLITEAKEEIINNFLSSVFNSLLNSPLGVGALASQSIYLQYKYKTLALYATRALIIKHFFVITTEKQKLRSNKST